MEWLLPYIRNGFPFIHKCLTLQKQNSLQVYEKYINSKYSLNIRRLKFLAKFEIKYIFFLKINIYTCRSKQKWSHLCQRENGGGKCQHIRKQPNFTRIYRSQTSAEGTSQSLNIKSVHIISGLPVPLTQLPGSNNEDYYATNRLKKAEWFPRLFHKYHLPCEELWTHYSHRLELPTCRLKVLQWTHHSALFYSVCRVWFLTLICDNFPWHIWIG